MCGIFGAFSQEFILKNEIKFMNNLSDAFEALNKDDSKQTHFISRR